MPDIISTFSVLGNFNLSNTKQNANSLNPLGISFYVESTSTLNILDKSYFQSIGNFEKPSVMSKAVFSSGTATEFISVTNRVAIYGQYQRPTRYVSLITELNISVLDQQNYVLVPGGSGGIPVVIGTIPFWS